MKCVIIWYFKGAISEIQIEGEEDDEYAIETFTNKQDAEHYAQKMIEKYDYKDTQFKIVCFE